MTPDFWRGRRVFLTGHTGFKGSWLALWLQSMGAAVHGYALAPPAGPSMFAIAGVEQSLASHVVGDLLDLARLTEAMERAQPEIVFHLAAQSLVRASYIDPVGTYATNVMGTVHCMEASRRVAGIKALVCVTTDKCYDNKEWHWGYREDEPLGGADPYSSSKAAAEHVTQAYRRSFLANGGIAVATARAGNVIGGGDWAAERLLPDVLRALDHRETLKLRSPNAIRPWQHVLEPLAGYLQLAQHLFAEGSAFAEAWNFGPADEDARSVHWIVEQLGAIAADLRWEIDAQPQPHEATYLKLDSSKARARLRWQPHWRLQQALAETHRWHAQWRAGADMHAATLAQIRRYQAQAEGA